MEQHAIGKFFNLTQHFKIAMLMMGHSKEKKKQTAQELMQQEKTFI